MKNKSTNVKNSILMLLSLLTFSYSIAQNESFVTMKNGKFYDGCEEFYPMIMNYKLRVEKVTTGQYRLAPFHKYCTNTSDYWSCGTTTSEYYSVIKEHLQVIDSMGFNSIRIIDMPVRGYINDNDDTLFTLKYYYEFNASGPNYHNGKNNLPMEDTTDYKIVANAMETLFNIIREENIDLRVIWLVGGSGVEIVDQEYSEYLSYMSNRFKDEPLLIGYDLYNEPEFHGVFNTKDKTKYERAEWFAKWYKAVKNNTIAQYVTYGPALQDFLSWDPEVLSSDFITYHIYSHSLKNYNWDHDTAFIAYKAFLKFASESITKPLYLGETGYPGIDSSYIAQNSVHPVVAKLGEHRTYIDSALQYTNWYGFQGYAHWDFKDDIYYPDSLYTLGAKAYFKGLIRSQDDNYTWKPAAIEYVDFDPSETCTSCSDPKDEEYYNVSFFEFPMDTGYVVDSVTLGPIKNAYVVGQLGVNGISDSNHTCYTFTDDSGKFIIRKMYDSENIIIKTLQISAPLRSYYRESIWDNELLLKTITLSKIDTALLPVIPNYTPWKINTGDTITWDYKRVMTHNVEVDSGAQLTITSQIYFNERMKLIVKRGGVLILDGGELTSNGNCGWDGIEVWGNKNHPPDSTNSHGKVTLKNSSLIENAEIGIRTVKMSESQGGGGGGGEITADYSYSGGKVSVQSGCIFRNCEVGVKFYPYSYDHSSGFNNVTFETTDSLLNSTGVPDAGVILSQVQDIDFYGCTFINSSDSGIFDLKDAGTGIYSLESDFRIDEYCPNANPPCPDSVLIPSKFKNLYIGVDTRYTTSNKYADIRNSEFVNNYRGLYASAMTNGRITSNTFEIDQPFVTNGGCGLYLDNCTGYWVEENTFYSPVYEDSLGVGIIVHNSGDDNNEIYRNIFQHLAQGISAQEQNRSTQNRNQGLQILCNEFDSCYADIFVPDPDQSTWGINDYQGVSGTDPEDMAGNLFFIPGPDDDDYDDLNNEGNYFRYVYPSNPDLLYENAIPEDITELTVGEVDKYITGGWLFDDGCPSQISSGGGTKSTVAGYKALFAYYSEQVDEMEEILTEIIDGGDTEALNTEVELSTPPETMEIYIGLMDESPYVSETVIGTSIEKENVLPNSMIRDVMVANPHSATSDELVDMLDERYTPMPNYMKAQILEMRDIQSIKSELESQLAGFKLKQTIAFNGLMKQYQEDTINPVSTTDSIIDLLQSFSDQSAKYRLAMFHLDQGEFETGSSVLNLIPGTFALNQDEMLKHENMFDYFNILKGIVQDGRSHFNATEIEVGQLVNIEEANSGRASAYARNILTSLNKLDYLAPIQLPDKYKSAKNMEEYLNLMKSQPPSRLEVFPNPSKDFVFVHYLLDIANEGTIQIQDVNGNLLDRILINKIEDQITIRTENWKPGLYIVTLQIDGKSVESCKFTLIK